LTPEDLAAAYKRLLQVERGWRDLKGALELPGPPRFFDFTVPDAG
jgi:hypothetical protein